MMASRAKQQNYRRLMKEVKGKSSAQQKKIDHPLARYNALGQLSCIVCQQMVKSELLWGTHLQNKQHKENVAILKSKKEQLQTAGKTKVAEVAMSAKRKPAGSGDDDKASREEPSAKKLKVAGDVETETHNLKNKVEKTRPGLPTDFFDKGVSKSGDGADSDSGDDGEGGEVKGEEVGSSTASHPVAGIPSNFFDKPGSKAGEKIPDSKNVRGSAKEAIPEGFFDDPKLDAKARKVEYKDKMEDEWEKFQKSIQKEKDVSEAIQFEEDEEAQGDRDLTEVQEQVECFNRAEMLRLRQEELRSNRNKGSVDSSISEGGQGEKAERKLTRSEGEGHEDGSGASDSDEEVLLEMDWRAKHS